MLVHQFLEESLAVDDNAGYPASADEPSTIMCGDGEREAGALDLFQCCFGSDLTADRGWLEVVELNTHPDGGLVLFEVAGERLAGRLFAQGQQSGGSQHGHVARPSSDRRIGLTDDEHDLGSQPWFNWHLGTISRLRRRNQRAAMDAPTGRLS